MPGFTLLSNLEIVLPLHSRPVTFHHVCRCSESALPLTGQRRLRNYVLVSQQVQCWPNTWGGGFEHHLDALSKSLLDNVLSDLLLDTRPVHDELGRGCEGSDRTRPTPDQAKRAAVNEVLRSARALHHRDQEGRPRRRSERHPGGECVYHLVHIPSPSRIPKS